MKKSEIREMIKEELLRESKENFDVKLNDREMKLVARAINQFGDAGP
jgi:hypothetical protein